MGTFLDAWRGNEFWIYFQTTAWKYLISGFYVSIVALLILPILVGFSVILAAAFLILTLRRNPGQSIPTQQDNIPRISLLESGPENQCSAFVFQFLKKQRNDYYFQSVSGFYNMSSVLPMALGAILNDYIRPYTTATVERILVVVPSMQSPNYSSLSVLKNPGFSKYQQRLEYGRELEYTHSTVFSNTSAASMGRRETGSFRLDSFNSSRNRLSYLDVSFRKYRNSPQNFYKEKRPIHFKFLSDA